MKKHKSSHKKTMYENVYSICFFFSIGGVICLLIGTVLYTVNMHRFRQFADTADHVQATVTDIKFFYVETENGTKYRTDVFLTFQKDGRTVYLEYVNYPNAISRRDIGSVVELLVNPDDVTNVTVDRTQTILIISAPFWMAGGVFILPVLPAYLYRKRKWHIRDSLISDGRHIWAEIAEYKKLRRKHNAYFCAICVYREGVETQTFKSEWFEGSNTSNADEMSKEDKIKVWYHGTGRYFVDIDDYYDRLFQKIMAEIEAEWDKEAE